jgi:hypothetical protein
MTQKLLNPQYDTFSATRMHIHTNGLAAMPVAGAFPSPSVTVALHGGLDYDAIAYTAVRRGAPPVVPSPKTTNPNRVFLSGGRVADFPITDFSGTTMYVVTGWLLFQILSPEGLESNFYIGNLPFPGVDKNEYIPGVNFQYQLVNQNQTQTLVPVPQIPAILQNMIQKG